jgi:hypothetical protein
LSRAKIEINAIKPAKRRTDFMMRDVLVCQVGHVVCWRWEIGFRRGPGPMGVPERGRTWRKGSPARRRGRPAPEKDCSRASALAAGILLIPPPTRHLADSRSVPNDPRRPSAQLMGTVSPDPRIPGFPSTPALFASCVVRRGPATGNAEGPQGGVFIFIEVNTFQSIVFVFTI